MSCPRCSTVAKSPRYGAVVDADAAGIKSQSEDSFVHRLASEAAGDRRAILLAELVGHLSKVMHLAADKIDVELGPDGMGVDSLMAVEMTNSLKISLGVELTTMDILKGPSLFELASMVLARMDLEDDAANVNVDEMSETDLNALLLSLAG